MGSIYEENKTIDVICQHTKEGRLIPLKVRLCDEDGEYHDFMVKGYRDYSKGESYQMPNGMFATSTIFPFEIKITTFGISRTIRLFYNCSSCTWSLMKEDKHEGT